MANSLGVAMIVKNEESCLEDCLKSVQGVDEIVILDTGSTDKTGEIARRYTNKYYEGEYEWNDNFAEARNLAVDKITTDWFIHIDADEKLDPGGVDKIRSIIGGALNIQDAIWVLMHHGDDQFYSPRVYRKHLRFEGRIHECIQTSCPIGYTNVGIEFNWSESHANDPMRNIRILEGDARRDPFNLRTQYCLAREYFGLGYFPNATYWFERYKTSSLKLPAVWDAEYADGVFTLAWCYEKMMDYPNAIRNYMEALSVNADFKEACDAMARLSEKTNKPLNKVRWEEFGATAQNRGLNFKTKGAF